MGHVRVSEHINAPVDHVWDMNVSCERLAEWNVNIVEVTDCPGRLDTVGAKATTIGRVMGRKVEGQTETIRVEKPQIFEERITGSGGIVATINASFAAAGGGTDVTVDVDYSFPAGFFGGIAEKLLGGSLERDTRHSMENFKELCEATAPARV